MRKIFALLALSSFALYSCDSDDPITPTPTPTSGTITAFIEGNNWKCYTCCTSCKNKW